ncbi:MAG TPA: sugar ABC transporter permease, partial [Ilumatobacteraceae bacterium]|nr:sugar ABC transporter permease [Ilumatobacteraceae bacterium]
MTEAHAVAEANPSTHEARSWRNVLASTEVDTRLAGMVLALALIWVGFNILSHGDFISSRNLWNLSVQSASIAIMATGMVLIIVSRNIDLSVGSLLGFLGYVMAMTQTKWIPDTFGLGLERPYAWIVALAVGILLGAIIGGVQGYIVAYVGVPAFIVSLGGYLVWRGLIFRLGAKGQTLAPLDHNFQLIGGGSKGSLGEWKSWVLAILGCVGIALSLSLARRRRVRYELPVRPMWVDVALGTGGCAVVIAAIGLIANRYISPITGDPTGVAYPVVILIGVTLVMTYLARRRRFGRYVYAYGGNPEAAELGGINTRRTIMFTFVLMGALCALSAAVQTARLNAAVTNLGVQNELDVISAAVIGGTSFSGGIGTIPGAVLGAVIMQSLRSGMVLLAIDSPSQDIVVGVVLVTAVAVDAALRLGRRKGVLGVLAAGLLVAGVIIQTGRPG